MLDAVTPGRSEAQPAGTDGAAGLEGTEGRVRPVIEDVQPVVDDGRFPAKRELGDEVVVEADVFADGHDETACELRWRHEDAPGWQSVTMSALDNDRWRSSFVVSELGTYLFCIQAAVDRFATWRRDLARRIEADQNVAVELLVGAGLLEHIAARAHRSDRRLLADTADRLRSSSPATAAGTAAIVELLGAPDLVAAASRYPDPETTVCSSDFSVTVDRSRARFGSWYEMFPRSASPLAGQHGTLLDAASRLPYVSSLGFDVLYLPPIHPIGVTNRKGRDGAPSKSRDDPGSPWAIGSAAGGHTAVHPDLGTVADVARLVEAAGELGMEVALDLALQCSPDHPWVAEHPDWFRSLPDGTIRYAENPPKRYEDIYPIDFDTADWQSLWEEIERVVRFWISHGIKIFRVDNPHTKPLRFWEWLISSVRSDHTDVIFLSEAFTRPKLMHRLAKLGFTQSYTYFTWRTSKWELESYLRELHTPPVSDFLRPNLWPNTPDILTEQLQTGGRATFMSRLVLAATLASSYGIYGPAYELQESRPRSSGSEEYLHSEKYELRHWDIDDPKSLSPFITTVNQARRDNPALQHDRNLEFHGVDNEQLVVYSRRWTGAHSDRTRTRPEANTVLVVVNLDPLYTQSGWVDLDLTQLGLDESAPYTVCDAFTGSRYEWRGSRNYVSLDPSIVPAHIFRVEPPGQGGEPQTKDPRNTDPRSKDPAR